MPISISFTGETLEDVMQQIEEFAWMKTSVAAVKPRESFENWLDSAEPGDSIDVDLPVKTLHNIAASRGFHIKARRYETYTKATMQ